MDCVAPDLTGDDTCYRGGHQACDGSTYERKKSEFRQVFFLPRSDSTYTSDLNAD